MRDAFLSNPLAAAGDFERRWSGLRDDGFCDHAEGV